MRVLIVEDEALIADGIRQGLLRAGFVADVVDCADAARAALQAEAFDLAVIDIGLPREDGLQLVRSLRARRQALPLMMLTARDRISDRVIALDLGADDYLTKPFHKDELIARIHAIVRRSKGHAQSVIQTGDLVVNLDTKTVEVGGQRVHLTGKEYQMLELLSLRKGTTLTKEMFLNHLYGGMDEPELKIIDVFICKLRKKLSLACGGANYIETVWGRGYVLREADEGEETQPQAAVA
jgi:two-component system cell cycle response regulator CtrA